MQAFRTAIRQNEGLPRVPEENVKLIERIVKEQGNNLGEAAAAARVESSQAWLLARLDQGSGNVGRGPAGPDTELTRSVIEQRRLGRWAALGYQEHSVTGDSLGTEVSKSSCLRNAI